MSRPLEAIARGYRARAARRVQGLAAISLLVVAAALADVMTGPAALSIGEVVAALLAPYATDTHGIIVWTLRLPAACLAISVGAALGAAGSQAQTILDNPIADPYTLGLSAAAGFGAAVAILFGGALAISPEILAPASAFLGGASASAIIYAVARSRRADAETMILAGIAVLFLFQALLSLLQYRASPEALQAIVFWLFGSLSRASWPHVAIVSGCLGLTLPFLMSVSWRLTALRLGEERARGLGIRVERLRLQVFAALSLLTAVSVCFAGTIGFIGLVAPHLARALVGEDQRYFLPMSALIGALMLSVASTVAKSLIAGAVFPIGIVTALVGVPFFFILILRGRRRIG